MRLLEVLRKLVSSLRRLLGMESGGASETPALPGGSADASRTPALAEKGDGSSPAEVTGDEATPTSATAPADPDPVENEPEIVVEIEGPESGPVQGIADAPGAAVRPAAAAKPATKPQRTPAPIGAAGDDATAEAAPEVAKIAAAATGPAKASTSRRRRRAAAYTQLEPALAVTPVRRFFSRLTAQDSNPLSESPWPQVRVESFFLALTQPRLDVLRGRGPAVSEPQALADAFADFVWD